MRRSHQFHAISFSNGTGWQISFLRGFIFFAILALAPGVAVAFESQPAASARSDSPALTRVDSPTIARSNTLTLDNAVQEGLAKSPRVQAARARANEARWRRIEALGGFLPQLSVNASHLFDVKFQVLDINFGPTPAEFPLIMPYTQATLDARLPVFDGLQNIYRYKAASLSEDASSLESSWAAFQVEQDVKLKFFQALAAQKLAVVADQNLKTLEDHLEKVRVRRSGGVATRYDVLRVEVQLDEARTEKVSSEDNVVVARARLSETLGDDNEVRPLAGDLPVPSNGTAQRVRALTGVVERPDIEALQKRSAAAEKIQTEASAYWVPKISLGYQYTYYNNVDKTFDRFRDAYSLGVFLNWNIFDGAVSIARHREAAESSVQAEAGARSAQLKSKTDFEFWKRRFLYSTLLYQAKTADVNKALESVRLATESFKAGTRTSSEVLDAELDLFRARAGAVQAQLNATEALINLEIALGRKI